MATNLDIKDGVLLKCDTNQKEVVIPSTVECVAVSAFNSCPEVHIINLNPDYVTTELADRLSRVLAKISKGWSSEHYTPCFPIHNIDKAIIRNAIDAATRIVENDEKIWHVHTLDVEDVIRMSEEKCKNHDIDSKYYIPTEENTENYGILFIAGIDKDNYKSLGANFDYNLIKYYSFLGQTLSYRWMVILGTSIRLEPLETFSAFSYSCCWMKNPKEYMEFMQSIGKLVK